MIVTLLHAGHPFTWRAWHPEPVLVGALVAIVAFYVVRLTTENVERPKLLRCFSFLLGVTLIILALASPLDVGAGSSFSLHMLQHLFLSMWAPPLLLMGFTAALLRPVLALPFVTTALWRLTNPLVCGPLFVANMAFWHLPPVYGLTTSSESIHYLMHLSFLFTGLLYWWPLTGPVALRDLSVGARFGYVFLTGFPMMGLAFALVSAPSVLYSYYETQPQILGLSTLADQQLGGALMGTLGEITMLVPLAQLFVRLLADDPEDPSSSATRQELAAGNRRGSQEGSISLDA